MMYEICKMKDGRFNCVGQLQDGSEKWICNTLESAIKEMKLFAKETNHSKIKKKQIHYYQEIETVVTQVVEWKPFK